MNSQLTAGTVEKSQAILEHIQVSVMSGNVKNNNNVEGYNNNADKLINDDEHNDRVNISESQRLYTSLMAGAIAGALAKTTIAPLDRTKINFQISKMPFSPRAAVDFLIKTYKTEGLLSLWRGNSATMVRIVPYSAIQFASYEQWKIILRLDNKSTEPIKGLIAGALAGVTSSSLTYPLDFARARMAVTQKAEYSTLIKVFSQIYKSEGFWAFYRGFTASILGVIPYAGCSFYTYDTLKKFIKEERVQSHPGIATVASLSCGAIAGAVGQTASYPLDIVRRRMQTSAIKGAHYHTTISTTLKIYQEEGIMAFYKGLTMNWVKGPVAVGISFTTNELIRDWLRKYVNG
ncbi:mitochondrial coenzyme A transporter SLC25A42 [Chelonus insularis]|uniref:mitochondrial coenzyme A transporter SLC25A42 n=1 Tax=Chelonus insularis TaxID=460826 RepID=UPI001589698D|nr:mitochondrial coenzyme A transporter SLC25A42 [Chelonus insularis]